MTDRDKVQKNLKEMDKLQKAYGGRLPEYISMFLAWKLDRLTRWLISLTVVLAVLAAVQIGMIIWIECRS